MSPTNPPTTPTDLNSSSLLSLLTNRRSYYKLTCTTPIPAQQIHSILKSIQLTVPSSFNTQSTRQILLLGPSHHKLWDITTQLLRTHMGEERWRNSPTASKIQGFRDAYGTVLFYEDDRDTEAKKAQFANYRDHFDAWSEQTSGMHQLAVWVALEAEGFGANLQHYNPVVDADVAREFDVPDGWRLRAQLVFGGIEGGRPDEKEKKSTEDTVKVFGLDEV